MTQLIPELKRLLRLGVLLVAAALTILISLGAQNQSVTVFYQVTSGRPNPSWEISDPSQIAQLQSLISGLPSAGKVQPPQFGAFLVLTNGTTPGTPQGIIVYNGVIEVRGSGQPTQFFQDNKGLTNFLASQAAQHGICANSDRGPQIVIGGCDTQVTNQHLGGLT